MIKSVKFMIKSVKFRIKVKAAIKIIVINVRVVLPLLPSPSIQQE